MAERTVVTLGETLAALVEGKKYATLRDILVTMNAVDVAGIFEEMPEEKLPLLFRLLPKELAAETFVEMEPEAQELLIRGFSDHELKEVVDELYVDDAVDIVEEMPANVVKRILRQADPEMRKMINEILKYPDDCAGSIMTTEYVSLRPNMTAGEAIQRIRCTGVDKETIYTCYITERRKLVGDGEQPKACGYGVPADPPVQRGRGCAGEHHGEQCDLGQHPGGPGERSPDVHQV